MANSRLYIVDTETKEYFLLGKGFGRGWTLWPDANELQQFLEDRDWTGSIGGPANRTCLKLYDEYDPEFQQYVDSDKYFKPVK